MGMYGEEWILIILTEIEILPPSQQGGKFHSLARSQSVEMGEGCWTATVFISLCFLIADVMRPAASHSCHLALTTMTDCTLKLCGFSFELLLPE